MYQDTPTDARSSFRAAQRSSLPYWRARAPEVAARRWARGRYAVWCDWCQADHQHGADELPAHRIAPCTRPDSPYKAAGYILVKAA